MNAFNVDWGKENNWVCPPISLIPRIIRHAQVCTARARVAEPVGASVSASVDNGTILALVMPRWCRLFCTICERGKSIT